MQAKNVKILAELDLNRKTKQEQDLLITRLAKIKDLDVHYSSSPNVGLLGDSMWFASYYLPGLDSFRFITPTSLTGFQLQELCGSVLDLFCTAANQATILIQDVQVEVLARYFQHIEEKVFLQDDTTYILNVHVCERLDESIRVGIYKRKYETEVTLELTPTHDLNDTIQYGQCLL